MKAHLLLSLGCLALPLLSQQGPPLPGDIFRWGELLQDQEVIGHFAVTTETDESLETDIFTLTLYDSDLHPIGAKTYPARPTFSVQDAVYDGGRIAILVRAEKGASVEVLNADATTVAYHVLQDPQPDGANSLYAMAKGFLVVEEYPIRSGNAALGVNGRLEFLATTPEGLSWNRRFGNPKARSSSTTLKVLEPHDDILLVEVVTEVRGGSTPGVRSTLHAINPRTGADLFTIPLPLQRPHAPASFYAAAYSDSTVRVLTHTPDFGLKRKMYAGSTELSTYDRTGRELTRVALDLRGLAAAYRRELEQLPLDDRTEFNLDVAGFSPSGDLSVIAATMLRLKNKVTFMQSFVYGFTSSGTLRDIVDIERLPLTVPAHFLGRGGPGLMGYQPQDAMLARQIIAHRGPSNHALTTKLSGTVSHYFWDRDLVQTGTEYRGIYALTLRDGAFVREHIPLTDFPYGFLLPARPGYVLLIEPDKESGRPAPHLKRLVR